MGELDFPCPDCEERSFATEAGLYMHRFVSVFTLGPCYRKTFVARFRRKVCGLKGVKLTDLDFLCQGEGCGRAFSSPMGLDMHRCFITNCNPETQSASYFLMS